MPSAAIHWGVSEFNTGYIHLKSDVLCEFTNVSHRPEHVCDETGGWTLLPYQFNPISALSSSLIEFF